MIRYYLVRLIGPGTSQREAQRPAYFAHRRIPAHISFDKEANYALFTADMTDEQHAEAIATEGVIYIGAPGESVAANRSQIIAAGYPVDVGESVDQLVGELRNLIWLARGRRAHHVALRFFGLDPDSRPTKAQEVAAARAGARAQPNGKR